MAILSGTDISKDGWGVIFPTSLDPQVREALQPLLEWRRNLAGDFYHEITLEPTETAARLISRMGAIPGYPDPRRFPLFLMIVGNPQLIPFQFQRNLGMTYAVGRLDLDTTQDYARYAQNVLRAEVYSPAPRLVFFAPIHSGEPNTARISASFIQPLTENLSRQGRWEISQIIGSEATKASLQSLLGAAYPPTVLLAAGHGLVYPAGQTDQIENQGSLVCQEWPGPGSGAISSDQFFSAKDIPVETNLCGTIQMLFSAFSAGTDHRNTNPALAGLIDKDSPPGEGISFTSTLAKRLLAHPGGPALGMVGVLGPLWSYSHPWEPPELRQVIFQEVFTRLSRGEPLGSALEPIRLRYAELAVQLDELQSLDKIKSTSERDLAVLWTALQDANSLAVMGDPAVRLNIASHENISTQLSTKGNWVDYLQSISREESGDTELPGSVSVLANMAALPGKLYPILRISDHSLFEIMISNKQNVDLQIHLYSNIEGLAQSQELDAVIQPGKYWEAQILPPARLSWPVGFDPNKQAIVQIKIEMAGRLVFTEQIPVRVIDPDIFPLAIRDASRDEWHDFSPYLGLFVRPDDPAVLGLLAQFGDHKQKILQNFPGSGDPTLQTVFELIRSIPDLEFVQDDIARKLSDRITLNDVTTPEQTLASGKANGVQAALLFVSVLEAVQRHPDYKSTIKPDIGIVLLDQKVLVGYNPARSVGWIYLDPIFEESQDFKSNLAQAEKLAVKQQEIKPGSGDYPKFRLVTLAEVRSQGLLAGTESSSQTRVYLTSEQRFQLIRILVDLFPRRVNLEAFLVIQLGIDPNIFATSRTYEDYIIHVVSDAENRGLLQNMLAVAQKINPGNRDLKEFLDTLEPG